ncbi:MAG: RluA family pseudouridine synthase [Deltaproteobacteria bacterium]|nr:RluA family pseudouridine synthase [Deltaproteobacteria bacterium]
MRGARSDQGSLSPTHSWTVPAAQRATRLDAFVRRCLPHLSLREAQRAIDEKAFWVNDRPGKKGDRLFSGDVLTFRGSQHLLAPGPLPGWDLKVPILYEDRSVLVVDKPAGMATHGVSGRETNTLANFLVAVHPSLGAVGRSRWEPGLIHRLDQDTSGIVLVAKEQDSFENLRSQFRRGLIKKRYWALVWGRTKREGVIVYPLIHDSRDRRKMIAVMEKGSKKDQARRWKASTRFQVLGYSQGISLLEVEMETGVTHQIRVHLEAIGHPLIGDPLYGKDQPDPFGVGRQLLHAFYLGFCHPKSGQNLAVQSPLPADLRNVLDRLRIDISL